MNPLMRLRGLFDGMFRWFYLSDMRQRKCFSQEIGWWLFLFLIKNLNAIKLLLNDVVVFSLTEIHIEIYFKVWEANRLMRL